MKGSLAFYIQARLLMGTKKKKNSREKRLALYR
jgi:hypothetical protein